MYGDKERDLEILQSAYPDAFVIIDEGIRFPDGTTLDYDDGQLKNFETLLENSDLEGMLKLLYPLETAEYCPAYNSDPGRFRPDAFFKALYGKDKATIRASLRPVQWMPSYNGPWLLVNTRFGIDKKLEEIIAELEALGPEYNSYLLPPGGTFNYRPIAGTDRLSPQSFGIALDIAESSSHYWQWESEGASVYRNSIPQIIVTIFEKHGFIWGGRWYHFDTMHFEYRPEILLKARSANGTELIYHNLPDS
jgi:hypothetical protein